MAPDRLRLLRKHRLARELLVRVEWRHPDPKVLPAREQVELAKLQQGVRRMHELITAKQKELASLEEEDFSNSVKDDQSPLSGAIALRETRTVAVISSPGDEPLAAALTAALSGSLGEMNLRLVERSEIDRIIREQTLQAGLGSSADQIRLGELLQCDLFLILSRQGAMTQIRAVDPRTAATLWTEARKADEVEQLTRLAQQLLLNIHPASESADLRDDAWCHADRRQLRVETVVARP